MATPDGNRCANCGLVFARHQVHDHQHPDMVRASFPMRPEWSTKGLYCPTVMSRSAKKPTEAPTSPSNGRPDIVAVDLRPEAITGSQSNWLIYSREQADHVLNTCYHRFVIGGLNDTQAIEAARQIAKAVDEAMRMGL